MNSSIIVNKVFAARNISLELIKKMSLAYSRHQARMMRKKVVKMNGSAIVDKPLKKRIKDYALRMYKDKSYWPYLALYTEIRGEFIEGWIPYDYYRYEMLPILNSSKYTNLSCTKTFDYRIFDDFAVKPLLLHISGVYYNTDLKIINQPEIDDFLKNYNDLIVVKEEFGMGGSQVKIMHSMDFSIKKINNKVNHVIQPYIKQHKILSDIYPDSVNTFKVTTYIDSKGNVSVRYVILRFGKDGAKVDNLSVGGEYVFFDKEGNSSEYSYHGDLGYIMGSKHKNTGYSFSEIRVPMYKQMLEKCMESHRKFPYLGIVGWDVCIDADGIPKLIEWNGFSPSFWEYEAVFGPFWTKDEINDMRV